MSAMNTPMSPGPIWFFYEIGWGGFHAVRRQLGASSRCTRPCHCEM